MSSMTRELDRRQENVRPGIDEAYHSAVFPAIAIFL